MIFGFSFPMKNMGNQPPSADKGYKEMWATARVTGEISVEYITDLANYHNGFPNPPARTRNEDYGRWYCDAHGIPRNGDKVSVGALGKGTDKTAHEHIVYDLYNM